MSVLRQQFLRQVAVTAAATPAVTTVDIFGPETPLAVPYAENTDHVIRERQVRQDEAGWVVIDGWDTSALDNAALGVTVEIWSRASSAAQKGLTGPLFPSGAAAATDPVLKRVVATAVPGNSDGLIAIFGGVVAGGIGTKDVPLLHVRADEFVRLTITNTGGALGPVTLSAKYNLGPHPADNQIS
jgi:hypothetical protein